MKKMDIQDLNGPFRATKLVNKFLDTIIICKYLHVETNSNKNSA